MRSAYIASIDEEPKREYISLVGNMLECINYGTPPAEKAYHEDGLWKYIGPSEHYKSWRTWLEFAREILAVDEHNQEFVDDSVVEED